MSELLGRARQLREGIDANNSAEAVRLAQQREQERIQAIQHEIDVRQSRERVAEFLELTRGRCEPTELFQLHDTSDKNWKDTCQKGWVMRKATGGYDSTYFPGYVLLADGRTYSWDQASTSKGQLVDGQIVYWRSFSPVEPVDDAYCGDEGLQMLGTKLAELGIID